MKKSRFTEEQIIKVIKRRESGEKTADICRDLGISQQAFYQWKSNFGGIDVSPKPRSYAPLKRKIDVSDRSSPTGVGYPSHQVSSRKKVLRPDDKREAVKALSEAFDLASVGPVK